MWFYRLDGQVRKGFEVDIHPDPRIVIGGLNSPKRLVLPLGASLARLIVGDQEDEQEVFILRRGDLKESNSGLVIVQQSEKEAREDERALVIINFPICDEEEGERIDVSPVGRNAMPQILHNTNKLLLFGVGDEAVVKYVSNEMPSFTMILSWDGRVLNRRRAHQ